MDDARHAQDMDMPDARHAQAHLRQAAHVHAQQRYFAPNSGYYPSLQQEPNAGMGQRRSVGGGIDVDALAAGVQRYLPNSNSGPPIASSSVSSRPPALSSSLSHPSLTSLHPHSHHPHHSRHPHMSLSSTPHAPSSSSVSAGAYIALPQGMDPSTVDFRTFYPYNPSEVKHRKRTTRGQLKILEETFRRETKPNAVMRKALAAELEMTPRGVQVWFQNRRAKEKALQKKAVAGGDKKPSVRLGKDKDDGSKDADEQEDGDGDDLEADLDCEDIDLDGDEKPDNDELSLESMTKAKSDSKSNSLDGSSCGSDAPTSNGAGSASVSPPPSGTPNSSSSSSDARPRLPLAVEIPQPPPVGVRVSPPTSTDDKSDGSPRRLSPSGTNVSRMSWSQGSGSSDSTQQQQHPSSAVLPPTRTTPTPNVPSLEEETLLSLRRPSLPTHLHVYGQNSVSNMHGSSGPPNSFRMSGLNARSARGLGSFSGVSSAGFQNGLSPLALNGIDPMQRRMSLDRLSRHPYAHLAAQANGMVFGARYRPSSALSGGSGNRLPIGPKTGLQQNQNLNAMQTSPNAGLQTIGSVGNTPMHTPQPRQSELPQGAGDAPGMDTEIAPDQGVPSQMEQQMQSAHQQQYLHITRPELMHRASLPAQPASQFRNPFDSIGAPNGNGDGSDGNANGTGDNAMQGIQTSANHGVPRGPLSASAIHSPPMFSNPFASSHHALQSQSQHTMIGPFSESGMYPANAAQMRFPREGHSYVLSARTYQPPLAGPLPNPDFQFGTGTSPGSGESDGSGSSGSPDPASGSSGGDTEQGLNHHLQNYSFPGPSDGGASDANSNANSVDASAGSGDVYEMQDLNGGMAPCAPPPAFHPYMTERYNSVVSIADSEVSVASHYSNAPSEVGSYDVGPHGHVQHAAHLQGFNDGRRPSYTRQMMEQFSNLDVHNGSNLSLAQQHASQQQQQLEAVAEQNSPMSNGHASPESAVAVSYASPSSSMSGGNNEGQQQQSQNQGPIISQSSELAYALQPTDNSRLHPNSSVTDVAGDLSVMQQGGEIRTRPESIDASSLATSHRTSSDMSSLIYPLSASASSSSSSLGFQPPPIHRSSDFRKPQPQLDMDFYHPPYDDVSETGHYSPISQSTSMSFDVPPSVQLNYDPSGYESHGVHMAHSHSMPPPQQQHAHLMGHGNNSYGQMQQQHHSQESLAYGVQSNNLGVGHSSDSFSYYN